MTLNEISGVLTLLILLFIISAIMFVMVRIAKHIKKIVVRVDPIIDGLSNAIKELIPAYGTGVPVVNSGPASLAYDTGFIEGIKLVLEKYLERMGEPACRNFMVPVNHDSEVMELGQFDLVRTDRGDGFIVQFVEYDKMEQRRESND